MTPRRYARIETALGSSPAGRVRAGLTEGWSTLYIDVDATEPHPVASVDLLPFREPLSWRETPVSTDADLAAQIGSLALRAHHSSSHP